MHEGLELEYQTAVRAEEHAGSRGARALFLTQWVETAGVARLHRQGTHLRPHLSLFTKQQNEAESEAGQGPAAGWSVTVHEVHENGTERLRLRASGAVPATSTHGTAAPPQAPTRHTSHPPGGAPSGGGSRAGVHEAGEERHRA